MKRQFRLSLSVFSTAILTVVLLLSCYRGGDNISSALIPSPPVCIAVSGDRQVTLTWQSISRADSYNIYWAGLPGVSKTTGTKISGVSSPYIHTELTNGNTYYYIVTAVNAAGESPALMEVHSTPMIDTALTLSDEILMNPGKGWLIYGDGSNLNTLPTGAVQKAAAGYNRFEWAQIEPVENDYHWEVIDNAMANFAARGLRFSFGIMPANSCTLNSQVTPKWVFDAGAAYTTYVNDCASGTIVLQAPVWNDPVFLSKLRKLITSLKARYDGHADIAFIDNRNCGNWGEWHSFGCSELNASDKAVLVEIFAGWTTMIVIPTNGDGLESQNAYGNAVYNHGCRRDSSEYHQNGCADVYDKAAAVSEWSTSYGGLKACRTWYGTGCWDDHLISEYMSRSRYSYDNMGQWGNDGADFYNEQTHLVNEWANRMGYWFRLIDAVLPDSLGNGETAILAFSIRNDGVAPIYVNLQQGGQTYVKLALLNHENEVLAVTKLSGINPYSWKPFDKTNTVYTETSSFSFPYRSGASRLAIGLFTKETIANPDIRLGNRGRISTGWYLLGERSK